MIVLWKQVHSSNAGFEIRPHNFGNKKSFRDHNIPSKPESQDNSNKLDFKGHSQKSKKSTDQVPLSTNTKNAWMVNHFVKVQWKKTSFIYVKWSLKSKVAQTSNEGYLNIML